MRNFYDAFSTVACLRWEVIHYSFDIWQHIFGMLYVSMQDILTWLLANTDDQLLTNTVEQLLDILSPTAGLLVFKHFRKVTIKKCGLLLMAFKYAEGCFYFGKCHTFAKGFCEHCASLKLFRSKTIC